MVNAISGSTARRRKKLIAIGERDGWHCWLCKNPVEQNLPQGDPWQASLDHVIPRKEGGTNAPSNLRLCHHRCNNERDARS